jgi:hypothetical protein
MIISKSFIRFLLLSLVITLSFAESSSKNSKNEEQQRSLSSEEATTKQLFPMMILWKCSTEFTPASDEDCRELLAAPKTWDDCDCFAFCKKEQVGCLLYDQTGEFSCEDLDQSQLCRAHQTADYIPPPPDSSSSSSSPTDEAAAEDADTTEEIQTWNTTIPSNYSNSTAADALQDLEEEEEEEAESSYIQVEVVEAHSSALVGTKFGPGFIIMMTAKLALVLA